MDSYVGRMLIADDDPTICEVLAATFRVGGYQVDLAHDLTSLLKLLEKKEYSGLILDLQLGQDDGLKALPSILKLAPYIKVFVLTACSELSRAVACMEQGATYYFTKDKAPQEILAKADSYLNLNQSKPGKLTDLHPTIIGESAGISSLRQTIERIKKVDSTVLILGESGTGKEIIARAIHSASSRCADRFEGINCAAIPENLLETELFGHRKGAFTDARSDRSGIFEVCSDGTLLLDEIGDMPFYLQSKLLRVLQEKAVLPLGASDPIPINTRVIAATHRDLLIEVKEKRFREDLFFRLSIIVVKVPPLRDRAGDIPILVEHFLKIFNERFAKSIRMPHSSTMRRLEEYRWPGNVRELQNAIERGVVLANRDELDLEHIFMHTGQFLGNHHRSGAESDKPSLEDRCFGLSLSEARGVFEKEYLSFLLKETHGNISEVARRAGRYRPDIYRLMSRYGLDRNKNSGFDSTY